MGRRRTGTRARVRELHASLGPSTPVRHTDGVAWRDLNGNGQLDVYEDPRAPIVDRVDDLLLRMTIEEKVGLMFHPALPAGRGGRVVDGPHPMLQAPTSELVLDRHIRHFNLLTAPAAGAVARWHNEIQRLAERSRLGIPVTFGSDPRHSAQHNLGAGIEQEGFSEWPGRVAEDRVDESARRLLRVKFELGLFDDPYVDEDAAVRDTGTVELVDRGVAAQRRSLTLLTNQDVGDEVRPVLPAEGRRRLYVDGVDKEVAARYGEVVRSPADADLAVVRRTSPSRRRPSRALLELFFPGGPLAYDDRRLTRILEICRTVPTIVDIHLERPAVIPEIAEEAAAVLVSYGAVDEVLLDAVFGRFAPEGRLPVELPSSMAAVEAARSDVPCDTADPLFALGHGLSW